MKSAFAPDKYFEGLIEQFDFESRDLSKWLVGLAAGAIVFSPNLITQNTLFAWKWVIAVGLVLLITSMVFGIRFLSLRVNILDKSIMVDVAKSHSSQLSGRPLDNEVNYLGTEMLVSEAKKVVEERIKGYGGKKEAFKKSKFYCFYIQEYSFYLGLFFVALFGIFQYSN